MALIMSSHWDASWAELMCESKSKQALSHQERKVLVKSTTPHCSFHPVGQPVSRTAWDDGALSFRFERVLKVRVRRRPGSLILVCFCHLVQQDKWTLTHRGRIPLWPGFDKQTPVCLHFHIFRNLRIVTIGKSLKCIPHRKGLGMFFIFIYMFKNLKYVICICVYQHLIYSGLSSLINCFRSPLFCTSISIQMQLFCESIKEKI